MRRTAILTTLLLWCLLFFNALAVSSKYTGRQPGTGRWIDGLLAEPMQQNGFFNAQTSFPPAPNQVFLKIDFATQSSSFDQFYMAVIMTRADTLAQSYYGIYSKADAQRLRDTMNMLMDPPAQPPVASSRSSAPQGIASDSRGITSGVQTIGGGMQDTQVITWNQPATTSVDQRFFYKKEPRRPAKVPKGAEYLGVSGNAYHWRLIDRQGVAHIFTEPLVSPK